MYVHLPFCVVRCTYCDFYSLSGQDDLAPAYVRALAGRSLDSRARGVSPAGREIYVGGGTPTYMPPGRCPRSSRRSPGVSRGADAEITVEANPESAGPEILRELRGGSEPSLDRGAVVSARLLAMMGRPHGPDAPRAAVAAARGAGFENVSADLIYGVPGAGRGMWAEELDRAVALGTEHLSVYLLETDKDTPLARLVNGAALDEPDAATIGALYRATESRLPEAGFARYEVSNWARPGRESRHNLGYWTDRPVSGSAPPPIPTIWGSAGRAGSPPPPTSRPSSGAKRPARRSTTARAGRASPRRS